jgi:hypothetical protein
MPTSEGRANLLLYEHAEQQGATRPGTLLGKLLFVRDITINKYPPAEPEVLRLLAPQRGLTAIEKSKSKTERTTNCIIPELSNFGSPPAEPGVYLD